MSVSPLQLAADAAVWSSAVALRRPPRWSTPHHVAREWPLARLRDFSTANGPNGPDEGEQTPTLLLPPQAGHDSCIVDYAPEQSQIRTARDAGVRALFSMDWKGATFRTRNASIERYRRFEDWFEHTQPIPGVFYLWAVEHLFYANELVGGTLSVGGRRVDLAALSMPLNLLAGEADHITPPAQVFALADHASTPAEQVVRHRVAGGHLGLFMGRQALRTAWREVFGEIAVSGLAGCAALAATNER